MPVHVKVGFLECLFLSLKTVYRTREIDCTIVCAPSWVGGARQAGGFGVESVQIFFVHCSTVFVLISLLFLGPRLLPPFQMYSFNSDDAPLCTNQNLETFSTDFPQPVTGAL